MTRKGAGEAGPRNLKAVAADAASVLAALVAGAALVWALSLSGCFEASPSQEREGSAAEQSSSASFESVGNDEMIVSVSPRPELADGMLRVNFVVVDAEGAMAERIEVVQGGNLVYASEPVQPGGRIEWAEAPAARAGRATATVYAVDGQGRDFGNPVDVEMQVEAG
ncbi:MAG: hypothetical protein IJ087_16420 [Eggerthellaceae bacterium]|nr:hypothetical protein [Eggerthellaceae bacterium]